MAKFALGVTTNIGAALTLSSYWLIERRTRRIGHQAGPAVCEATWQA